MKNNKGLKNIEIHIQYTLDYLAVDHPVCGLSVPRIYSINFLNLIKLPHF